METLLDSPLVVTGVLATADLRSDPRGAALFDRIRDRGLPVQDVSAAELESASDTEAPQGVLAIAEIPDRSLQRPPTLARYLILDALQDPGNVGTVIRTAAALGVTATIALPGTVDLWNAKVVRSSMGATFIHQALSTSWDGLTVFLNAHAIPCWAADTDGIVIDGTERGSLPPQLALVVGNEGAGISQSVAERAVQRVAIRMAPGIESLNVAVATGILLHALRRW